MPVTVYYLYQTSNFIPNSNFIQNITISVSVYITILAASGMWISKILSSSLSYLYECVDCLVICRKTTYPKFELMDLKFKIWFLFLKTLLEVVFENTPFWCFLITTLVI